MIPVLRDQTRHDGRVQEDLIGRMDEDGVVEFPEAAGPVTSKMIPPGLDVEIMDSEPMESLEESVVRLRKIRVRGIRFDLTFGPKHSGTRPQL